MWILKQQDRNDDSPTTPAMLMVFENGEQRHTVGLALWTTPTGERLVRIVSFAGELNRTRLPDATRATAFMPLECLAEIQRAVADLLGS